MFDINPTKRPDIIAVYKRGDRKSKKTAFRQEIFQSTVLDDFGMQELKLDVHVLRHDTGAVLFQQY